MSRGRPRRGVGSTLRTPPSRNRVGTSGAPSTRPSGPQVSSRSRPVLPSYVTLPIQTVPGLGGWGVGYRGRTGSVGSVSLTPEGVGAMAHDSLLEEHRRKVLYVESHHLRPHQQLSCQSKGLLCRGPRSTRPTPVSPRTSPNM